MTRPTPVAFRRIGLGAVITALLLAAWKLPLLESVAGIAVLEPSAVWYVAQSGNSLIRLGWDSNLLGHGGEQTMIEFERSDVVRVELNPKLRDGSVVAAGDTIATILSLTTESSVRAIEAQLARAKAEHTALVEGARPADVEVAKRQVEYAEAELEALRPELERIKGLNASGYLALEEVQKVEGKYQTLMAAKSLAESTWEALKVGARPVDMEVAASEIKLFEEALEFARQRHELRRVLISPIPGVVKFSDMTGNIVKILRNDTLAAFVSLPETMLSDLEPSGKVKVTLAMDGLVINGTNDRIIFRQSPTQGSFVVAYMDNASGTLKPGMHGHAEVETRPRSLLSSVNRTLRARLR